jgi:NAD-dependent dihydropyrimidine dehydrogenase PreA subunit
MAKAKLFTCIATFVIFSIGRIINLLFFNKASVFYATQWGIFYGIWISVLFYFIVDLVIAKGLIQVKITFIKILFSFLIVVILINQICFSSFLKISDLFFIIESSIAFVVYAVILILDNRLNKKPDYFFNNSNELPEKYFKLHPLKTFFELLFRLFPFPEPIGLYKVGNPNKNSIIIVTGNYDLTIRRVVKSLSRIDCWLLICDSRGINIWCSSLSNNFNTDKIINAINIVNLKEKVNCKKLILPQLCASNISIKKIRKETEYNCEFGPLRINDIGEYLLNPKNHNLRKITFNIKERTEMAGATVLLPIIITVFIFNFFSLQKLFIIIPVLYALSFLSSIIFPYRMIKNIRIWSLFFGLFVFGVSFFIFSVLLKINIFIYSITISVGIAYLINEFEGWSPLAKFSFTSSYNKPNITIDEKRCIGCGNCTEVCPKEVYSINNNKSKIINLNECISCKSCISQCLVGAIDHSAKNINDKII